jgi:hypothetical protein
MWEECEGHFLICGGRATIRVAGRALDPAVDDDGATDAAVGGQVFRLKGNVRR